MKRSAWHREHDQFIQEMGIQVEHSGMPRMAGKILALMLLSDKQLLSSEEIARALVVSKGTVSTLTRLLIQSELVDRVSRRGDRRDYFRLKPKALPHMFKHRLGHVAAIRALLGRALALKGDNPSPARARLEETHAFFEFMEEELPLLFDKWERHRRKPQPPAQTRS